MDEINIHECPNKVKAIPKLPNFQEAADLSLLSKEYFIPLMFLPLELDSIYENLDVLSIIGVDDSEHFEYLQHQMALWAWKIYKISCEIHNKLSITEKRLAFNHWEKFLVFRREI